MNPAEWFSPIEWVGVVATLINVWLAVRADIRNFIFGLVAIAAYGWVFWQGKLYGNFWLYVGFYLPTTIMGWWTWLKMGPNHNDDLPIKKSTKTQNILGVVATIIGTVAVGVFLDRATDGAQPYLDAFTTCASIVGQIYLVAKREENWLYWIPVNSAYAFILMPMQGYWPSAVLFFILLVMAVKGYLDWKRAAKDGKAQAA